MKVDAGLVAMKQLESATIVVRAYAQSDCARAITTMLDALIDSYKIDLMHVSVDGLVGLQACINQAQAIRNAVNDDSNDLPKI
jgi:hypothetical protein